MDEMQDGGRDVSGADGARRGGQGADGCEQTIEEWVSHGEDEEEEENNAQHIEKENREAVRVVQGCAESWKTHVVAEGMAQHRTHQMTCPDEYKGCISSKYCSVGELEHCREENP